MYTGIFRYVHAYMCVYTYTCKFLRCLQVPGCERSALIQAFSEFMLRGLGVEQDEFDVSVRDWIA